MKFDPSGLYARKLTPDEAATVTGSSEKQANIVVLARLFAGVEVGEGVEIGPFNERNEASTVNSNYTGQVTKYLKWGGEKPEGRRFFARIRERDGLFYIWVVRRI